MRRVRVRRIGIGWLKRESICPDLDRFRYLPRTLTSVPTDPPM
jgi:hypothetical protein